MMTAKTVALTIVIALNLTGIVIEWRYRAQLIQRAAYLERAINEARESPPASHP